MGTVAFNDGTATVLSNGQPTVLGRAFADWSPRITPVGEIATALSSGRREMWVYRTQFDVEFRIDNIPTRGTLGGADPLETAQRLVAHLLRGGTCDVTTEDDGSRVYLGAWLTDGATPSLDLQDASAKTFSLTLPLTQLSAPWICRYLGLQV